MNNIPEIKPEGVELYDFTDTQHFRNDVFSKTLDAVQKNFPKDYGTVRLEFDNLHYEGPDNVTPEQIRKARLHRESLARPLKANVILKDRETGEVLDSVENKTIMRVPYRTDRATFFNKGSGYTSVLQRRLLPGVYARKTKSGDLESFFNVAPGSGSQFRILFNPEDRLFKLKVKGKHVKLYPVLKSLGFDDQQLKEAWGDRIWSTNMTKSDMRDIDKLAEMFKRHGDEDDQSSSQSQKALDRLLRGKVSSGVVNLTLGPVTGKKQAQSREEADILVGITPDMLFQSSQKLLRVNRGDEPEDKRDAAYFSKIYTTGDMIADRINVDADHTYRNAMRKLSRKRTLEHLSSGFLNAYVDGQIVGNSLSAPGEETNPLYNVEQQFRITSMGDGGIGSDSAISESMQNVDPHEFGFIDPIAGPECLPGDYWVYTQKGWKQFTDLGGDELYLSFKRETAEFFWSRGEVVRDTTSCPWKVITDGDGNELFRVTPNHRLMVGETSQHKHHSSPALPDTLKKDFWMFSGLPALDAPQAGQNEFEHTHAVYFLAAGAAVSGRVTTQETDEDIITLHFQSQADRNAFLGHNRVRGSSLVSWYEDDMTVDLISTQKPTNFWFSIPENLDSLSPLQLQWFVNGAVAPSERFQRSYVLPEDDSPNVLKWRKRVLETAEIYLGRTVTHTSRNRMVSWSKYAWSFKGYRQISEAPVETSEPIACVKLPHQGAILIKPDPHGFPFWTFNSSRAGVDVRAVYNSKLGSDRRIYQRYYNPHQKRYEWLSAWDLIGKTIALND